MEVLFMKTRKSLSIILAAVVLFTSFISVFTVHAATVSVTTDKNEYTVNEKIVVTVSNTTKEQEESNAFVAIYKKGARYNQYMNYEYIYSLIGGKWEFNAPSEKGEYEIRFYEADTNDEDAMLVSVPIQIKYITDRTATLKTDKEAYTPNEDITVTVDGVTETQIRSNAYVAIYKKGGRHENYMYYEYIYNLIGGKWTVKAPSEVGDYEIRLYAADVYDEDALYVSIPLKITYTTTEAMVQLNKSLYAPNEKMTVTVGGVTEAQIQSGAFAGIYRKDDRHEKYINYEYVYNMIAGKWETAAPYEIGEYELRLYAANTYSADALLISVPFTVSGAPVDYLTEGVNGISGWAVPEVQEAIENNLTTPKVMIEFQKAITREEFCELAVKLYESMTGKIAEPAPSTTFSDTNNPEVLKAYNLGIVAGVGNGKFAPDNYVTRQEIATMLLRVVKVAVPTLDVSVANPPSFADDYDIADWAREGINYFASKEIIKGANGVFLPNANCTCEAAIALVKRVFDSFSSI